MKSHPNDTPPSTRRKRQQNVSVFSEKHTSPFLSSRLSKSLSTTQPVRVEKISARYSSKALTSPVHASKPSYEEVLKLDIWKEDEDEECRSELVEIERAFKLKQSHQDDVERELHDRRTKVKLPSVVRRSTNELQDLITGKRLEIRKHELTFREKSRFSKIYEDDLERTRLKYEAELEERTFEREQLRISMSQMRKYIIDISLDLDRMKEKRIEQEESVKRSKDANEITLTEYFYKRSTIEKEIEMKVIEVAETTTALNSQLQAKSSILEGIDRRVHQIKENIKLIQRTQMLHYYNLLKEGWDTRNEGLEWIVKALWALNCDVKPSRFPAFMDYTSISKVLEFAELSLEYDHLHKALAYEMAHSRLGTRNADRLSGVKTRLKNLKSNTKTQSQTTKYDKVTRKSNMIWQDDHTESPSNPIEEYLNSTLSIEKQMIALTHKINELKNNEVSRLTHACFMSNYEKKHNVDMKTILSCIVGTDCIDRYMASINREQKALTSQLLHTKTYKFSKRD